ncbi:MAG: hypothetical protein NVS3B7_13960 [Candidatus Elarobacter sp.]
MPKIVSGSGAFAAGSGAAAAPKHRAVDSAAVEIRKNTPARIIPETEAALARFRVRTNQRPGAGPL